jgi:hypothetical protein
MNDDDDTIDWSGNGSEKIASSYNLMELANPRQLVPQQNRIVVSKDVSGVFY